MGHLLSAEMFRAFHICWNYSVIYHIQNPIAVNILFDDENHNELNKKKNMFRSNSCLANNLNCYDPSILTSAHIKRSISTLNKILSQNEKKAQSKCGNSSFGCVNDFTLTHRARNPKHKAFLTNQTRLRMIKSVNNLFNEKLPQLEKYTLEEKQYNKDDYIYDKIF